MLKALYQDIRDEKLFRAFKRGDQGAFEQLYSRHASRLVSHLYRLTGNSLQAEDIAQEAWLAVIRNSQQFDSSQRFSTWLFTIARRKQIDLWRKQSTQQDKLGKPLFDVLEQLSDAGLNDDINQVSVQDLIDKIHDLSSLQLEALLLKIAGFSQHDIATITSAQPEAVKSRIRYATRALRSALSAQ